MTESGLPLLTLLITVLPLGALLVWLWPRASQVRWVALVSIVISLLLSIYILYLFEPAKAGFQLVENKLWMPTLNARYHIGVDGISILFLPLTSLLFLGVMAASWNSISRMPRLFFAMLLLLQSATMGIFTALDGILFFFFWELTLIPLYFLVIYWGVGPNRRYAAVKYTLFMMAAGVAILFAFILLAFNHEAVNGVQAGLSFDYLDWLKTPMDSSLQVLVFSLLLIGFAVKVPIVPFHTWLPVVAMQGPVAIAATIIGLKLGAYGLIRFTVPLAPTAAVDYSWLLAALGTVGVVYGAIVAMAQTNLRRMLAFSSISHVGLVVLGIASMTAQGLQGAVFLLLNFVIVSGGLFLLVGLLQYRTGSTDINSLGGVAKSMPLLSSAFLFLGLASMGVPGTSGFPAEFLILYSVITTHTGAGLAALSTVVLGAAYFLSMYRKAFLGTAGKQVVMAAVDLQRRELLVIGVIALLVLVAGFYPSIVLDVIDTTVADWVKRLKG